eukprot:6377294-Prymnesium_polylepis.1
MKPQPWTSCSGTHSAVHASSVLLLHSVVSILRPRLLDDVAVVVNVFALLTLDESLIEFDQDSVRRQKLHLLALPADRQNLRHKVRRHLWRLRSKHAERELPQLGRGVVEQEIREDHAGRERVHTHLASHLWHVVPRHTLGQLCHQR